MKDKLETIYTIMLKEYHYQGWWPVTPIGGCKGVLPDGPAYGIATHNEKQRLEIIFGAILTQNTSWKNVEKALINLNQNDLIDIDRIITYPHEKLAECIKSSGYHNQKAERLKIISKFLKHTPINKLKQLDIQTLREILLKIKGIGPETADSIILYALDKPVFVIDAYTKRIFSRIGLCEKDVDYDDLQDLFMKNLEHSTSVFNEYHALLVEHAKRYCNTKPLCEKCILRNVCERKL